MSIEIEYEVEFNPDFNVEELASSVINECLDYEKCPFEATVNLTFVNNEGIKTINCEHRNIDRETDVLSFPMVDYEAAGDFSFLEEEDCYEYFDPDSGELILGDIVISVDKANEQAIEYNHSLKREIAFLIAHSMFHLMGYDHMEDSERIEMESKQKDVLNRLGISRED